MQKKIKNILLFPVIGCLCILMFLYPAQCLIYSLTGLNLWFQKMIPALFPFMVISGVMIRMNLTDKFASLLKPILYPLFHISNNGIFAVISGFLFGFPMGARIIADLYQRKRLSKNEAGYLLTFCNNIGPIYFISFALAAIELKLRLPYLIGMYGLPFLYGLLLRHTVYKNKLPGSDNDLYRKGELCTSSYPDTKSNPPGFLEALDESITSGLHGITKLGGYMIFFNLLNIIPHILLPDNKHLPLINGFIEITSGISLIGNTAPLLVLILLPFGGLSCIAQTYSVLSDTDLSIGNYVLHKIILTGLTILYYLFYLSIFSLI